MYRHTSSNSTDVLNHIELETYKVKFDYESIDCMHCKERMWDYYKLEGGPYGAWPYNFMDFDSAFQTTIPAMIEMGLDPSSPKLQLRGEISDRQTSLHICPICGWWIAVDSAVLPAVKHQFWLINLVAPSALMELSLTDVETPITEIRNHLRHRYDDRHCIHPRIFEETVASVFRDLGYDAYATAYSNDGGIDVVLKASTGESIGVQVKRHQRRIQVEQIRSFLGALILGGFNKGIFVSTSPFQRGAVSAARESVKRNTPIELVDPDRFFDMLGIAQLNCGPDPEECGFYQYPRAPSPLLHSCFHLSSL